MASERSVVSSASSNGVVKYPNPFFDLSKNYMPTSIKSLFGYCRTFFHTNLFINNVVRKLTEYPITDLLFEDNTDSKLEHAYTSYFDKQLHLKELLISIGLDYFTYGNCFVTAHMKFKRNLKDIKTGELYPFDDVKKLKIKNGRISGTVIVNGSPVQTDFEIIDIQIKNVTGLTFTRLNPTNIEIDYDEFSGESKYYYLVPADVKKKINAGNRDKLEHTPKVLIDAVLNKKKVLLDHGNLYHFKMPTLAEDDQGWGKPLILPAMKQLYYMATLQRGNEAIAVEHIVPKQTIFPSPSGAFDLHNISMSNWTSKATANIEKWRRDPNHIAIMPIPMGYQQLGGTGRAMLTTPELKFVEETVINGLGVPLEFVKGGANWTGSSVSLRIIENHFINYRERIEDFLNFFVVSKMSEFLRFERVTLKFTRMRMNDDSETKQMAINLNQMEKISDETLLKELRYDPAKEKEAIIEEADYRRQLRVSDAMAQAEAQGKAQLIIAKYQVQAQVEAQDEGYRAEERVFKDELEYELGVDEDTIHRQVKKLAATIMMMPDEASQLAALKDLQMKSPVTYSLVVQRIQRQMSEAEIQAAEVEKARIDQESERLDMADKAIEVKDRAANPEGYRKIKPRNEDKSGPKKDASSGKQKA